MANERILELIRKEEVVLFIGAGMSIYAGFPSGAGLAKILFDNLTDDLKTDIEFTYNLPKLCDDIYTLKGGNKNYLIETLKKEFRKPPTSTETHKLLAGIPHFRNIVTTNYDTLIETENPNIEVIRKSKDLATTNHNSKLLFKIHSDFTDTDRLILTNSDYLNYFTNNSEDQIFWNVVKDRLATNHILFVGYSLEDTNVKDMLNKIMNELGENRKEIYFASPAIDAVKRAFLSRHNISFIESTGENLIKIIDNDIKLNYLPNLSKGIGRADTAIALANSKDLCLELRNKGEAVEVGHVTANSNSTGYKFDFKVQLPNNDKDKFEKFFKNQSFDELVIDKEILKEFSFFISDLRIHNENNISSITLQKRPNYDCNINIVFEDDFEIDNYAFKFTAIKPSETQTLFQIVVDDFTIIMELDLQSDGQFLVKLNQIPSNSIRSTNSGLQFYEILSRITSNLKYKIFKDGTILFSSEQFRLPFTDAYNVDHLKDYFKDLKKIEKHFNVRFKDIDLNKAYENRVKLLNLHIENVSVLEEIDTVKVKCFNDEEFEILKNAQADEQALIIGTGEKAIYHLHGLDFDLGYKFKVIDDLIIINKESLNNWKNTEIIVKSKSNIMRTIFSPNKLFIE